MKSKLKIFIFLISCLFLLPINANGKSYISDYTSINSKAQFKADEFTINLRKSDSSKNLYLLGGAYKNISDIYYYHYVIYLYNDNYEQIGAFDGYNGIWSDNKSNSSTVNINIDNQYMINNAYYYKLFVEPSNKDIVSNYLYLNVKLNDNGIDKINEPDAVLFKTSEESYINTNIFNSQEYVLTNYDVNITVNEDNSYLIKETITAYFNVSKHGIFRKIPLKNIVVRNDGSKSSNRAKITNIKLSDPYSSSVEDGYRVLKIGESTRTLTGEKKYTIEYLYNIGNDPNSKFDEFYFNIIGSEWDTYINNVTFTITMPKEFDASKLGFAVGAEGSTNSEGVEYEVDGNVITGKYNDVLKPQSGLTMRLELPDGYFVKGSYNLDAWLFIMFIIPIFLAMYAYSLWRKYGKDEPVVETVEFYPPNGLNSAELGFLYNGTSTNKGVISLLIYLANKGYLKITETESPGVFGTYKSFQIEKLRSYDGNNEEEGLFMDGLFKGKMTLQNLIANNVETEKNIVTESDLRNNFYTTLNAINARYNNKSNREKIFEKNSINKGFIIFLLTLVNILLITYRPMKEYGDLELLIPGIIFPLIAIFIIATIFSPSSHKNKTSGSAAAQLVIYAFVMIWGGGCIFIPFASIILPALLMDPLYLIIYISGFICSLVIAFLGLVMEKRNAYGREMLGKIGGFKKFLITAEKSRLEALVEKDPKYFYNILPYTYALDVSDKWVKQFESIQVEPPSWYCGTSTFNMTSFGKFMDSTMSQAESSMSSSPSSSSGGGSSGGGSGGGGGGSW